MTFLRKVWYVTGWADEVEAGQVLAAEQAGVAAQ
jgi:hypothetical protein